MTAHQDNMERDFTRLNISNYAPKQYSPNLGKKIAPVVPPKPNKKPPAPDPGSSSGASSSNTSCDLDNNGPPPPVPATTPAPFGKPDAGKYAKGAAAPTEDIPNSAAGKDRRGANVAYAALLQPGIPFTFSASVGPTLTDKSSSSPRLPDIASKYAPAAVQPPPRPEKTFREDSQVAEPGTKSAAPPPPQPAPSSTHFRPGAGGQPAGAYGSPAGAGQHHHHSQQLPANGQAAAVYANDPNYGNSANYSNPSNYSNSSNYSNASNYSNMANYSDSSNYSNSSNYSDFSNYDHYNPAGSLTSYGGAYTPPPPEDDLPPPPPPEHASYTPATNHSFPPPPPPQEEFPPPPSPVSSSYSELRRAANAQNYNTYGPVSSQSSTYDSIYEPIHPRPQSQMSNRSLYSTGTSLYTPYGCTNKGKVQGSAPHSLGRPDSCGPVPVKEDEVDVLTNLLVRNMENSGDPDFFGICGKCGEKVAGEGNGCTAMEQVFHISCFVCYVCQTPLQGKPFYGMDGKPYCEEDYLNTLEKCCVCTKPILDRILRATGKPYHPQCFLCCVCGKSLDGIPFTVDAVNQIHCIEDFHKKFAPRCCVCKQPIMPESGQQETVRVVALDKSFHVNCYKCEDCGLVLSSEAEGRGCYPMDEHILCKSCNAKRVQLLSSPMATEL